jgi:hypothetical protein
LTTDFASGTSRVWSTSGGRSTQSCSSSSSL